MIDKTLACGFQAGVHAIGEAALASHRSAARLWGVPRPDDDPVDETARHQGADARVGHHPEGDPQAAELPGGEPRALEQRPGLEVRPRLLVSGAVRRAGRGSCRRYPARAAPARVRGQGAPGLALPLPGGARGVAAARLTICSSLSVISFFNPLGK